MNTIFYIYRHIRLDTNTPFYVGKGKDKRAWSKGRNKYWKNIVSKTDYKVEIIIENLTEKEAFAKEMEFIKMYKDLGYCEANMTLGGEGCIGRVCTEKTRKKIGKANSNKIRSEETRKKLSESHIGQVPWIKGKNHSEETRKKLSESHIGQVPWNKGKKVSQISGKNHPQWVKFVSEKTKELISKSNNNKLIVATNIKTGEKMGPFTNYAQIAKYLKVSRSNIWKVLHNKRTHTGGYKFEYLKEK